MYPEERQQAIAAQVAARGRASVAELARALGVTTETVRRDLAVLDRAGALRRVHGGAVPARAARPPAPGLDEREATRAAHKQAIAERAAGFFPESGATVLFDAGTTTGRVAALLPPDRDLLVVTNSVPIAARLAGSGSVALRVLGGRVRGVTQACLGAETVSALAALRVDVAFVGADGVTPRHGLSTPDPDEAAAKRAMVDCANLVVVVADSSKMGREEFVSFAAIESVDVLVTDGEIGAADRAGLTGRGLDVVVAQGAA